MKRLLTKRLPVKWTVAKCNIFKCFLVPYRNFPLRWLFLIDEISQEKQEKSIQSSFSVIQGWLLNLFLFSFRVTISHAIDNSLDFYCRLAVMPKKVCVSSLGKISGILKISEVSLWNNIQPSKCLTEPIFALIRVSLYSQTHRFPCDVYL